MLTARARRIDSRVIALVAAILAVALLVGAVVVYLRSTSNNARALCAQLPDSAGLYAGNAVNIRGVKVGTVTSLNLSLIHI